MDSPVVAQLFRQLFSHRASQCLRAPSLAVARTQRRGLASSIAEDDDAQVKPSSESRWQQRTDIFPEERSEEFRRYPMVTADSLRSRKERPRRVKMLMRDFIEGIRERTALIHCPQQPADDAYRQPVQP